MIDLLRPEKKIAPSAGNIFPKIYHFLRIIRRNEENIWDLIISNWLENDESAMYGNEFHPTKPITMDAKDLQQFAKEMREKIKKKPEKETEFSLTFRENEPQFKVVIRFMTPENPFYGLFREELKEKFQLSIGFNYRFSKIKHTNSGDEYLYENGGRHQMAQEYYSEKELEKFVDDIEKEIAPFISNKKTWQFWKKNHINSQAT